MIFWFENKFKNGKNLKTKQSSGFKIVFSLIQNLLIKVLLY